MDVLTSVGDFLGPRGGLTLLLALLVVLGRLLIARALSHQGRLNPETRRRWIINIRNALLALFGFGLLVIWAPELRTLALSLVAIAVALVVAFKEVINCVSGAVLRFGTTTYGLGDRIEISGIRGVVVDTRLLTTTLLEIAPGQTSHLYTGRAMIVPNSLLLSTPLTNETYTKRYVLHITRVPLTTEDDLPAAEKILLDAAWLECRPYLDDAQRYMKQLEGRHWLDSPWVEPHVTLQLKEPGFVDLLLRVPCPPSDIARYEQSVLRRLLSEYPQRTGRPLARAAEPLARPNEPPRH